MTWFGWQDFIWFDRFVIYICISLYFKINNNFGNPPPSIANNYKKVTEFVGYMIWNHKNNEFARLLHMMVEKYTLRLAATISHYHSHD